MKKLIDTLNDLPNIIWEIAAEQPGASFSGRGMSVSSMTFWAPHLFGLIKTYEEGAHGRELLIPVNRCSTRWASAR